jgi:hypothetical protein
VVQDFIRTCATYQRYKSEHLHPVGLLLPLPMPVSVWADIGMDFIEALPRVDGKSVILTIVDRFSKYCHFVPLAHPYSAESVAQAFFSDIVRLHGIPQSIVFDRGSSVHVAVLEGAHAPGQHQAPYDDGVLPAV